MQTTDNYEWDPTKKICQDHQSYFTVESRILQVFSWGNAMFIISGEFLTKCNRILKVLDDDDYERMSDGLLAAQCLHNLNFNSDIWQKFTRLPTTYCDTDQIFDKTKR